MIAPAAWEGMWGSQRDSFYAYVEDFFGHLRMQKYIEDWVLEKSGAWEGGSRNVAFLPFPTRTKAWNKFARGDRLFVPVRFMNFGFILLALGVSITNPRKPRHFDTIEGGRVYQALHIDSKSVLDALCRNKTCLTRFM